MAVPNGGRDPAKDAVRDQLLAARRRQPMSTLVEHARELADRLMPWLRREASRSCLLYSVAPSAPLAEDFVILDLSFNTLPVRDSQLR